MAEKSLEGRARAEQMAETVAGLWGDEGAAACNRIVDAALPPPAFNSVFCLSLFVGFGKFKEIN